MMEGVSNEAASVAGHLKLGNLTWIYDSNHITIEGPPTWRSATTWGARLGAMGWHVIHVADANDTTAVAKALDDAKAVTTGPTIIVVHSIIGYGAPKKAGTREAHGEPLGDEEIKGAKRSYGWPEDAQFLVPDGVHQRFAEIMGTKGAEARADWLDLFADIKRPTPNWQQRSR